jgi:hypothetical protein
MIRRRIALAKPAIAFVDGTYFPSVVSTRFSLMMASLVPRLLLARLARSAADSIRLRSGGGPPLEDVSVAVASNVLRDGVGAG